MDMDIKQNDSEVIEKTSVVDIENVNNDRKVNQETNQCNINLNGLIQPTDIITTDDCIKTNTQNWENNNNNNNNYYNNINNNNNCNVKKQNNVDDGEENSKENKNKKNNNTKKSVLYRVAIITVGLLLSLIVILVWYYMGWIYGSTALLVAIITYIIISGKWRWFYIAAITTPRDVRALGGYIKILRLIRQLTKRDCRISDVFVDNVSKNPNKPCILYEDQTWTFKDVNEFSNQIANFAKTENYKKKSVVGLYMDNCPEFVATWLGLSKLGVIIPLINTNQRNKSLIHSINIAECEAVIFGDSYKDAIDEIIDEMPENIKFYIYNFKSKSISDVTPLSLRYIDLNQKMINESKEEPKCNEKVCYNDKVLYIYTSGTTGLPKAAVITNARFVFIVSAMHYMMHFTSEEVIYTPLPLYHTAGGIMTTGQALLFGATIVIRKKFSASNFFPDCAKYNCTAAQYIGEMCRYILATPSSPADKNHKLRVIYGNGLRPQIWVQFCERFNIKRVGEFYGATEGNANIVNVDNTVGSIGFVSRIFPQVYPISIIRADPLTGEPIRGKNGLCQVCKANEPGVFIGKIIPGNASRQFLGYVDRKASEKKVVYDVFKKGDSAFLSGDILVSDERGSLFFKDRTGDTFRWKGENVSTSEVEAYVSNEAGYRDVVVYGVEIPNLEGRAGMAAILDPEHQIDFKQFAVGIKKSLPSYARPLFIRQLSKVDMTGTFKLRKLDLQIEGFDPSIIEDQLYYLTSSGAYEILTKEIYTKICNGEIRF